MASNEALVNKEGLEPIQITPVVTEVTQKTLNTNKTWWQSIGF